ncbi:MAG: S8 family serine peptidase [Actinomycetes bacterium]
MACPTPTELGSAATTRAAPFAGNQQWALSAVGAVRAWRTTTGVGVRIGVIDSGVATVPGLTGQLAGSWTCRATCRRTPAQDSTGHGTEVAGIIAADGSSGVVGLAPGSRVVSLRVTAPDGTISSRGLRAAVRRAAQLRLPIVNISLTENGIDRPLRRAITTASDTLFVVGAGNDSSNIDQPNTWAIDPCSSHLPNVLCVTATDERHALADFANWGKTSVNVAAPGVALSTLGPVGQVEVSGTSFSTALVTGAAGLVKAAHPRLTPIGIRNVLLRSAAPVPGLQGRVSSGGTLNAARAVRLRSCRSAQLARECLNHSVPHFGPTPMGKTATTLGDSK